jgi:hypothetical protein
MRALVDAGKLDRFLAELGKAASAPTRVYLVGGAVALRRGWRETTIDIDLRIEPDSGAIFRALPDLKERLGVSVELASPLDFLPELPGWRDRSQFVRQEGHLAVFEMDPYAQALAKIERGFSQDMVDVRAMFADGLLEEARLRSLFEAIVPELYRFPAVDEGALREDVEAAIAAGARRGGE